MKFQTLTGPPLSDTVRFEKRLTYQRPQDLTALERDFTCQLPQDLTAFEKEILCQCFTIPFYLKTFDIRSENLLKIK
jgi:hypothetical protein